MMLLSFVDYKIELEERSIQENDFCKFADFVHVSEAHFQNKRPMGHTAHLGNSYNQ